MRPLTVDQACDRAWLDLSLAQQAIWLDAKLNPQSPLQLGGWARIEGEIDEASARQALGLVIARHEALKLRVDSENPRQWLSTSGELPFTVIQMEVTEDPQHTFEGYMEDLFLSPFALGDAPLFRLVLIKAHSQLCFLLWRFHHLIADSLSTTLAMRYWTEAYLAITTDDVLELASRSSYTDLIASDYSYLNSKEYKDDLDYWMTRFRPLPCRLIPELLVNQKNASDSFYSDWNLTDDGWLQVEALAAKLLVSPSRILFAAFVMAAANRFQQDDIVGGVALHKRDGSSMNALGMFSGVLPVRFSVNNGLPAEELIRGFSRQIDQDMRHQRMPVNLLARELSIFRLGRKHLFELVMSFLPADRTQNNALSPELPVTSGVVTLKEATPISMHITELVRDGVNIRVAVNPEVLDGSEAAVLLCGLQLGIEGILKNSSITMEALFSLKSIGHAIVDDKGLLDGGREEWII